MTAARLARHVGTALAIALAAMCGACEAQQKPTPKACSQPGATRQVPLRTMRVLDDDYDTPGSPTNKGCRLTNAQIQAYIAQAQSFYASTCKIDLQWDGQIRDLIQDLDDMVMFGCTARERRIEFFWQFELQDLGYYSPNHINIYFHGNMRFSDGSTICGNITLVANTVDPGDEAPYGGVLIRKHILVNDRAGVQPSYPGVFTSGDRILEHELAHWFLRQRQSQGGRYDDFEHCPSYCTYIMKVTAPHPAQFWETPPAVCERFEIWTKAATWNTP